MFVRSSRQAPLFSVILPTYNRPEMLKRSVASVRMQSLGDFELLVVDDGSAEDCTPFVTRLGDDRIKLIRNLRNAGAGEARNLGIDAARGAYISFIDDDDEYVESFLANTLTRLAGSPPEVGMTWCGVQCVDHARDAVGDPRVRTRPFPTEYPDRASLIRDFLSVGTGFGVTIKAECLAEVGGFNPGLRVVCVPWRGQPSSRPFVDRRGPDRVIPRRVERRDPRPACQTRASHSGRATARSRP